MKNWEFGIGSAETGFKGELTLAPTTVAPTTGQGQLRQRVDSSLDWSRVCTEASNLAYLATSSTQQSKWQEKQKVIHIGVPTEELKIKMNENESHEKEGERKPRMKKQ
jgi:hypothetical protein